jgi:hypothetical protein
VPGLGAITAAGLTAAMPELGQVSNEVAAASGATANLARLFLYALP